MGNSCRRNAGSHDDGEGFVRPKNDPAAAEPSYQNGQLFTSLFGPIAQKPRAAIGGDQFPDGKSNVYVTRCSYQARTAEDLSFQSGERLEILAFHKPKAGSDWWYARAHATGRTGYVPKDFLTPVGSLDAEPWYFGRICYSEAEQLLKMSQNSTGAFLVRESESFQNQYSLSVLNADGVKHYRIRYFDDGKLYVCKDKPFARMQDLVAHYRETDALDLCLNQPCLRIEKPTTSGLSYDTQDHWQIDRRSLEFKRRCGQGQFGEVYEGMWNKSTPVAIKKLKEGCMVVNEFLVEAETMKKLRHPKLIQLYAVCTTEEPILIVFEFMKHGSLLDYLRTPAGQALRVEQLTAVATQIACGMTYLESQNYIHRDLAARNVLVGDYNVCKIADFGLTRLLKQNETDYIAREGTRFPVKWSALEVAKFNRHSIKSDVWSFGILLHELLTYGQMPYAGWSNAQALCHIDQGYRLPRVPICPAKLYKYMLLCWQAEPAQRPTFEVLHKWLRDFFANERADYMDSDE